MFEFRVLDLDSLSDVGTETIYGENLFTTKEWMNFIVTDSKVLPLILEISLNSTPVGYLYGMTFYKFGVKIFGSPFNGWSTCYMGLKLTLGDKLTAIREAVSFLFDKCGVMYAEITDRDISLDDAVRSGIKTEKLATLELDLSSSKTDEELMSLFRPKCRNLIRQFEKRGASLEFAEPNNSFAEEYYDQLKDVFAKQGLVPTYSLEKIYNLLNIMGPTGNTLCLRVRDPYGKSIATSIFFGHDKTFYFFGGASYREGQHYLPNEYMIWSAIKYFRARGCTCFDMVGVRDYKRKFGSKECYYPKLKFSKFCVLISMRDLAQKVFFIILRVKGLIKRRK